MSEAAGIDIKMDEKTKELIAVGAAVAGNCIPCLEWHFKKCIELKIPKDEIKETIELSKMIKDVPIKKISELADKYLNEKE